MSVPQVYTEDYTFRPGKAVTVRTGDDVTLISNGTVLWRASVAAERLAADGISARVISMPTVKPLAESPGVHVRAVDERPVVPSRP
jgi:transketolase